MTLKGSLRSDTALKVLAAISRSIKDVPSFQKTAAVVTAACFLLTSVLAQGVQAMTAPTPAPRPAAAAPAAYDGLVPASLGRISDARYFGGSTVVINIQDLHCHGEVQRNISGILSRLDEKYGLKNIYVEGAFGGVDTSWINRIQDPAVRGRVLEGLIDEGKLTGSEYFSITSGKYDLLKGLEEEKPYLENLVRLKAIIEQRRQIGEVVPRIEQTLADLKEKYFTASNRHLDDAVYGHAAQKVSSKKYYRLLLHQAEKAKLSTGEYRNIHAYVRLLELQEGFKFKVLQKEMQAFVGALKERVPYAVYKEIVARAQDPALLNELYLGLAGTAREYNVSLSAYPELGRFLEFAEANRQINPVELLREEKRLVRRLHDSLALSRAEQEISFLSDFWSYANDYLNNRITAEDYEYYVRNIGDFKLLWAKYVRVDCIPSLERYYALFDRFYQVNVERNEYFLKNALGEHAAAGSEQILLIPKEDHARKTVAALNEAKDVVVVVTGGFHTAGMSELLKEHRVTYLVITPNVTGGTLTAESMYDRLAGEQAAVIASQTIALWLYSQQLLKLPGSEQHKDITKTAVEALLAEAYKSSRGDRDDMVRRMNESCGRLGGSFSLLEAASDEDPELDHFSYTFRDDASNASVTIPVFCSRATGEVSIGDRSGNALYRRGQESVALSLLIHPRTYRNAEKLLRPVIKHPSRDLVNVTAFVIAPWTEAFRIFTPSFIKEHGASSTLQKASLIAGSAFIYLSSIATSVFFFLHFGEFGTWLSLVSGFLTGTVAGHYIYNSVAALSNGVISVVNHTFGRLFGFRVSRLGSRAGEEDLSVPPQAGLPQPKLSAGTARRAPLTLRSLATKASLLAMSASLFLAGCGRRNDLTWKDPGWEDTDLMKGVIRPLLYFAGFIVGVITLGGIALLSVYTWHHLIAPVRWSTGLMKKGMVEGFDELQKHRVSRKRRAEIYEDIIRTVDSRNVRARVLFALENLGTITPAELLQIFNGNDDIVTRRVILEMVMKLRLQDPELNSAVEDFGRSLEGQIASVEAKVVKLGEDLKETEEKRPYVTEERVDLVSYGDHMVDMPVEYDVPNPAIGWIKDAIAENQWEIRELKEALAAYEGLQCMREIEAHRNSGARDTAAFLRQLFTIHTSPRARQAVLREIVEAKARDAELERLVAEYGAQLRTEVLEEKENYRALYGYLKASRESLETKNLNPDSEITTTESDVLSREKSVVMKRVRLQNLTESLTLCESIARLDGSGRRRGPGSRGSASIGMLSLLSVLGTSFFLAGCVPAGTHLTGLEQGTLAAAGIAAVTGLGFLFRRIVPVISRTVAPARWYKRQVLRNGDAASLREVLRRGLRAGELFELCAHLVRTSNDGETLALAMGVLGNQGEKGLAELRSAFGRAPLAVARAVAENDLRDGQLERFLSSYGSQLSSKIAELRRQVLEDEQQLERTSRTAYIGRREEASIEGWTVEVQIEDDPNPAYYALQDQLREDATKLRSAEADLATYETLQCSRAVRNATAVEGKEGVTLLQKAFEDYSSPAARAVVLRAIVASGLRDGTLDRMADDYDALLTGELLRLQEQLRSDRDQLKGVQSFDHIGRTEWDRDEFRAVLALDRNPVYDRLSDAVRADEEQLAAIEAVRAVYEELSAARKGTDTVQQPQVEQQKGTGRRFDRSKGSSTLGTITIGASAALGASFIFPATSHAQGIAGFVSTGNRFFDYTLLVGAFVALVYAGIFTKRLVVRFWQKMAPWRVEKGLLSTRALLQMVRNGENSEKAVEALEKRGVSAGKIAAALKTARSNGKSYSSQQLARLADVETLQKMVKEANSSAAEAARRLRELGVPAEQIRRDIDLQSGRRYPVELLQEYANNEEDMLTILSRGLHQEWAEQRLLELGVPEVRVRIARLEYEVRQAELAHRARQYELDHCGYSPDANGFAQYAEYEERLQAAADKLRLGREQYEEALNEYRASQEQGKKEQDGAQVKGSRGSATLGTIIGGGLAALGATFLFPSTAHAQVIAGIGLTGIGVIDFMLYTFMGLGLAIIAVIIADKVKILKLKHDSYLTSDLIEIVRHGETKYAHLAIIDLVKRGISTDEIVEALKYAGNYGRHVTVESLVEHADQRVLVDMARSGAEPELALAKLAGMGLEEEQVRQVIMEADALGHIRWDREVTVPLVRFMDAPALLEMVSKGKQLGVAVDRLKGLGVPDEQVREAVNRYAHNGGSNFAGCARQVLEYGDSETLLALVGSGEDDVREPALAKLKEFGASEAAVDLALFKAHVVMLGRQVQKAEEACSRAEDEFTACENSNDYSAYANYERCENEYIAAQQEVKDRKKEYQEGLSEYNVRLEQMRKQQQVVTADKGSRGSMTLGTVVVTAFLALGATLIAPFTAHAQSMTSVVLNGGGVADQLLVAGAGMGLAGLAYFAVRQVRRATGEKLSSAFRRLRPRLKDPVASLEAAITADDRKAVGKFLEDLPVYYSPAYVAALRRGGISEKELCDRCAAALPKSRNARFRLFALQTLLDNRDSRTVDLLFRVLGNRGLAATLTPELIDAVLDGFRAGIDERLEAYARALAANPPKTVEARSVGRWSPVPGNPERFTWTETGTEQVSVENPRAAQLSVRLKAWNIINSLRRSGRPAGSGEIEALIKALPSAFSNGYVEALRRLGVGSGRLREAYAATVTKGPSKGYLFFVASELADAGDPRWQALLADGLANENLAREITTDELDALLSECEADTRTCLYVYEALLKATKEKIHVISGEGKDRRMMLVDNPNYHPVLRRTETYRQRRSLEGAAHNEAVPAQRSAEPVSEEAVPAQRTNDPIAEGETRQTLPRLQADANGRDLLQGVVERLGLSGIFCGDEVQDLCGELMNRRGPSPALTAVAPGIAGKNFFVSLSGYDAAQIEYVKTLVSQGVNVYCAMPLAADDSLPEGFTREGMVNLSGRYGRAKSGAKYADVWSQEFRSGSGRGIFFFSRPVENLPAIEPERAGTAVMNMVLGYPQMLEEVFDIPAEGFSIDVFVADNPIAHPALIKDDSSETVDTRSMLIVLRDTQRGAPVRSFSIASTMEVSDGYKSLFRGKAALSLKDAADLFDLVSLEPELLREFGLFESAWKRKHGMQFIKGDAISSVTFDVREDAGDELAASFTEFLKDVRAMGYDNLSTVVISGWEGEMAGERLETLRRLAVAVKDAGLRSAIEYTLHSRDSLGAAKSSLNRCFDAGINGVRLRVARDCGLKADELKELAWSIRRNNPDVIGIANETGSDALVRGLYEDASLDARKVESFSAADRIAVKADDRARRWLVVGDRQTEYELDERTIEQKLKEWMDSDADILDLHYGMLKQWKEIFNGRVGTRRFEEVVSGLLNGRRERFASNPLYRFRSERAKGFAGKGISADIKPADVEALTAVSALYDAALRGEKDGRPDALDRFLNEVKHIAAFPVFTPAAHAELRGLWEKSQGNTAQKELYAAAIAGRLDGMLAARLADQNRDADGNFNDINDELFFGLMLLEARRLGLAVDLSGKNVDEKNAFFRALRERAAVLEKGSPDGPAAAALLREIEADLAAIETLTRNGATFAEVCERARAPMRALMSLYETSPSPLVITTLLELLDLYGDRAVKTPVDEARSFLPQVVKMVLSAA